MADGNKRVDFVVKEGLKGGPPAFSRLETTGYRTSGATDAAVGSDYLLFINNDARLEFCPGSYRLEPRFPEGVETLQALRDFADGGLTDLSEPWEWQRGYGTCVLKHDFATGKVSSDTSERWWLDGAVRLVAPSGRVRSLGKRNNVQAEIALQRPLLPEDESIMLTLGDEVFEAKPGKPIRPSGYREVTYRLAEEDAAVFAQSLTEQGSFSLEASDESEHVLSTTVRITRGRANVQGFADCVRRARSKPASRH